MFKFNYNEPVPCYKTDKIQKYLPEYSQETMNLFQLIREIVPSGFRENHCIILEGSFSIRATSTKETSAKIVMYQRGIGLWWFKIDPGWSHGVYVWIRANDISGRAFQMAAKDHNFRHRWVLSRFEVNRAVSVAPNPNEHFYYFKIEPNDNRSQIAELLAFCSTL